jgi:hypothetical protein
MTFAAAVLLVVASLTQIDTTDTPDCTADACIAWFDANAARLDTDGDRLCELARERFAQAAAPTRRALFTRLDAAASTRRYAVCALAGLGAAVLPPAFDYMVENETREARWTAAQEVIRLVGAAGVALASRWLHTAADVDESPAPRIAALRALEALGAHAASVRAALDPLSRDEDPEIREAAKRALAAIDAASGDAS